jgi:uncharacterized protein YbcV (DUF1398 family)
MNTALIQQAAEATLEGSRSFPEIVGLLLQAGVEYYHVDYVARRTTYYGAAGTAPATTALPFERLPEVAPVFSATELKAAILDSQRNGQKYRDFSRRAMAAGVQGYYAFLTGKRVTYLGRTGDQHTEWFPGAAPSAP